MMMATTIDDDGDEDDDGDGDDKHDDVDNDNDDHDNDDDDDDNYDDATQANNTVNDVDDDDEHICFASSFQQTCTVLNLLFHWSPLIYTSIVFRDRGIVMWQFLLFSQLPYLFE